MLNWVKLILKVKSDQMLTTSSGSALYFFHSQKKIHFQKGREEGIWEKIREEVRI